MPSNANGTTTEPLKYPYIKTIPMPSHTVIWRNTSTSLLIISSLDGDKWSALRPGRFNPMEKYYSADWMGGWGGGQSVRTSWRREKSLPSAANRTTIPALSRPRLVTLPIELPPFLPNTVQTVSYKLCPLFYFVINTFIRMREKLLQQFH
jgi:hypothetical protein